MKYLILLVFCLGVQGRKEIKPYYDASVSYQEEDVTDECNFIHPCSLKDNECMRKFLVDNSECKPAYGRTPDPLHLDQNTVFFPLANMTNILAENTITGLGDSEIVVFRFNDKTKNLIFAIEVTNMNETIQKSIYRFRRTGKEPIIRTAFATVLFKKLIFTCIVPKFEKLRLDLAECHAEICENYPAFYVGPNAFDSKDPDVIDAYNQFVKYWPMLLREAITTQVTLLTSLFIQKTLCDFGYDVKSI